MRRSLLALPVTFAALLLLAWGILVSPAQSAPAPAPEAPSSLRYLDSTLFPGWRWTFEEVDPAKTFDQMTDRSLALDAAGNPHLAYGQNHLYYLWFDGADWRFHLADRGEGVGGYAALALDENGLPHISYYDQTHGDLRYAHFDGSAWLNATVDSAGDVGQYTSIALDATGNPHISYSDAGNTGLKYASFDGAAWVVEPLDGAGDVGSFTSLALDGAGQAHIAYYGGGHLKYAHDLGATWQISTIDPASQVGKYASLALDDEDHPHIGYYDEANQDVKYAAYDGAAWHIESVDTEGNLGAHTSLALDTGDLPRIAYFAPGEIRIAAYDGADWQFENLAGFETNQTATSLALDASDQARLAVTQSPQLHLFTFDGADWQEAFVDYAGYAGRYNDIALDAQGHPHFSYCVSTSSDARVCDFAKYLGFDGLEWHMAVLDRGGYNTAIALDTAGHPHISYVSEGELHYAGFDGASWQVEAVEALGSLYNRWLATSIAVDSSGLPHISYCLHEPGYIYENQNCGALKYAHLDGTQWISATLDSAGMVGGSSSIGLDDSGHAHISYIDDTDNSVNYAFFDGAVWLTETLDTAYAFTSLNINQEDHPEIVYSLANQDVKYAPFDGYAWHPETALSLNWNIRRVSLDSDALGQPHFLYYQNESTLKLGYALHDASGWHHETLIPYSFSCGDEFCRYAALALDANDQPHLSEGAQSLTHIFLTPIPLQSVSIEGPQAVLVSQANTYTAVIAPLNALQPITFTWGDGASGSAVAYSWTQSGVYTISVRASNLVGIVSNTLTVTVRDVVHLPVVFGYPQNSAVYGYVTEHGTGNQIPGASVCVLSSGQCAITDESGYYQMDGVLVGEQTVRASAEGYYDQEMHVSINIYGSNWVDFYLTPLVQTGTVAGQVTSATTGQGIGGANVCAASGSPCTTADGSGNYTLSDVLTGQQTLRASASGYFSLDQNVTVNYNQTSQLGFVLSPALPEGEMRIVLTWGADPSDLDAHLWLPTSHPYHVYWYHTGNCAADPYACLDIDDRNSYGPETITIKQRFSGTYRFAVNKYEGNGPITASGAHVRVYNWTGLIAEYWVPTSGSGDWWYVFDIDGDTGTLTTHDTIQPGQP